MPSPLLSVITVTYNAEDVIEKTIKSIIHQTYGNVEYIVIDGHSTDKTVDIIRRYEKDIAYWISEPDSGLYDAMNKGISMASGEWVCFMNAGDLFYKTTTIEDVFDDIPDDAHFIYGSHYRCFNEHERPNEDQFKKQKKVKDFEGTPVTAELVKTKNISELWKGVVFSHQSVFVRSALMRKYPFNTHYKVAADYDFIFNRYVEKYKFFNSDCAISVIAPSGLSGQSPLLRTFERWRIVRKKIHGPEIDGYYLLLMFKYMIPSRLRKEISRLRSFYNTGKVNRIDNEKTKNWF